MTEPSNPPDAAPLDAAPHTSPASPGGPYAAWGSRDFRCYAVSWFSIMFSKLAETVAVGVVLYEKTSDPLSLAWIGLVQALPVILLAIAGGQIADRFDRRRVMMGSLALSTASALGWCAVAHVAVVAVLVLSVSRPGGDIASAGQSVARRPVAAGRAGSAFHQRRHLDQHRLSNRHDDRPGRRRRRPLHQQSHARVRHRGRVPADCPGGRGAHRVRPGPRPTESVSWSSLAAGIRFVWHTKLILATITLDLFAVLLGGAAYLMPVFAEGAIDLAPLKTFLAWACGLFGASADFDPVAAAVGILRSAEAVGAVTMAVLLAHMPPMRRAGLTLLWAVGGFGAATIVFGLSTSFCLSLAAVFVIGALDNISVVVRHTLVQLLTPDAMRGRVSAVNNIFIVASNDLGGFESGLTAWLFGPVTSVVAGGICAIAVVLATTRIWPEVRSLGRWATSARRSLPTNQRPRRNRRSYCAFPTGRSGREVLAAWPCPRSSARVGAFPPGVPIVRWAPTPDRGTGLFGRGSRRSRRPGRPAIPAGCGSPGPRQRGSLPQPARPCASQLLQIARFHPQACRGVDYSVKCFSLRAEFVDRQLGSNLFCRFELRRVLPASQRGRYRRANAESPAALASRGKTRSLEKLL